MKKRPRNMYCKGQKAYSKEGKKNYDKIKWNK